jgi:hypothetical protein
MSPTPLIIPANPGFYVAWPKTDGEDCYGFYLDPIIAWRIEGDDVTPLCPDGDPNKVSGELDWAIKTPDGKFIFLHRDVFDTEEKALAFVQGVKQHQQPK